VTSAFAELQRASYERAGEGLRSSWPEERALDAAGIGALLDRHRYCVLATARRDGRAHAAPVAFVVHGAAFWFATVEGLRLRNLRARPWASIVVMEGDAEAGEARAPHVALTAEGPVTLHGVDAYRRLETEWLRRHTGPPDWAAAFVELRPERLFSYDAARA
jgi:nitroimidazol reductase NimA-like FMN-containing flavoprotein (pyridoxamine 5'-phosphate oxidase superfamily)